mgnify:CR=1 FL=1
MKSQKVFIISLHKTGTTSVTYFLEKFGYLMTGPDTHLFDKAMNEDYDEIDSFLEKFDGFQDDPWYMMYSYVYNKYPNAKFVFLKRNSEDWIRSVQSFYGRDRFNNRVRRLFYGNADTIKYESLYLEKFETHTQQVKNFFEKKDNYIEIDVKKPNDAVRLQRFLGERIKYDRFPHKNNTPKNKYQLFNKKLKKTFLGWFGLKRIFKNQLRKKLSKDSYLNLRSETRFIKSRVRVFKNNLFK